MHIFFCRIKKFWFRYIILFLLILKCFSISLMLFEKDFPISKYDFPIFSYDSQNDPGRYFNEIQMQIYFPEIYKEIEEKVLTFPIENKQYFLLSYGKINEKEMRFLMDKENDNRKKLDKAKQLLLENEKHESLLVKIEFQDYEFEHLIAKQPRYKYLKNYVTIQQNFLNFIKNAHFLFMFSRIYRIFLHLFFVLFILMIFIRTSSLKKRTDKIGFIFSLFVLLPVEFLILFFNKELVIYNHFMKILTVFLSIIFIENLKGNKVFLRILACSILGLFFIPIIFNIRIPFYHFTYAFPLLIIGISIALHTSEMTDFKKKAYKKWDSIGSPIILFLSLFSIEIYLLDSVLKISHPTLTHFYLYLILISVAAVMFSSFIMSAAIFSYDLKYYNIIRKKVYYTSYFACITSILWTIFYVINFPISWLVIFIFSFFILKAIIPKMSFLKSLRFDERYSLTQYIFKSQKQLTVENLFIFTQGFLYQRFLDVKIGFYYKHKVLGDQFESYDIEAVSSIDDLFYLNLDMERSNETEISKIFPDEPNEDEVRLYFPVQLQNDNTSFLLVGSSYNLFWTKEEADFFYEIVKIFSQVLETIHLNSELRNKQIAYEKESEKNKIQKLFAEELQLKNTQLADEKRKIQESIDYASRIQQSILPSKKELDLFFKSSFQTYFPRDTVSGDFYWFHQIDKNKAIYICADCTGHGVPGAFLTIASNAILNHIIRENDIYDPAIILNILDKQIKLALHADNDKNVDGLDLSVLFIDKENKQILFSGANSIIYTCINGEVTKLRSQRKSIGDKKHVEFQDTVVKIENDMKIYLSTDGLFDMLYFDGKKRTRFKTTGFHTFIEQHHDKEIQQTILEDIIKTATSKYPQRDDITVLGIEI